jgi:hyaluronoglucosaminidase
LLSIAEYLADPHGYDPEAAWERALHHVAGAESYTSLRCLAENSLGSCLQKKQSPEMSRRVKAALKSLAAGESIAGSAAVAVLAEYFNTLDEATYHLKNRMANFALRQELMPWIEALDEKFWMGRGALLALKALEDGTDPEPALRFMEGLRVDIEHNPKHIGGNSVLKLARIARERARESAGVDAPRANRAATTAGPLEPAFGALAPLDLQQQSGIAPVSDWTVGSG